MRIVEEFQMLDWKTREGFESSLPEWFVERAEGELWFRPRNEYIDETACFETDSPKLHVDEGDWVVLMDNGEVVSMSDELHSALPLEL